MLKDLTLAEASSRTTADVVVVGAGIAGLLLGKLLRHKGLRVVVLESGGRTQDSDTHPLNHTFMRGSEYRGASHGRFRCLGGTSTRWGGALIPIRSTDMAERCHIGLKAWPITPRDLSEQLPKIERLLGLRGDSYGEEAASVLLRGIPPLAGDGSIGLRFAKWPPFRSRNFAHLFAKDIKEDPDLEIWLNATVVSFDIKSDSGAVSAVSATSEGKKAVTACARNYVLCAGAIECTRLMLVLDRLGPRGGRFSSDVLGRYLHDHVSTPLAEIVTDRPAALNRMAAFRFQGATMRSPRFELEPQAQVADQSAAAFGHISFASAEENGFDILREIMRGLQAGRTPGLNLLRRGLTQAPYFARVAYWRMLYKQLHWPVPSKYSLHVVAEQTPRSENRIVLGDQKDALGMPIVSIDWRIGEPEMVTFRSFMRRFDAFWRKWRLDSIGKLVWVSRAHEFDLKRVQPESDVYHPAGTTSMSTSASSGVVDPDLTVFGVPNLSICSTSVFPTSGSANPTLTLMMLAARLAERLAQNAGQARVSS